MKKSQGSILAIVIIMVGALYLLAGMVFIVNQQYFSDMLMARSVANNRQKLLSVGQDNLQQMSKRSADQKLETWQHCDVVHFPEQDIEGELFLHKVQLANHCNDGHSAHRILLASLDNWGDRLVIDQLMAKEDWRYEIDDGQHSASIVEAENVWKLILNNGVLSKEIILIESENLPKLVDQIMRTHEAHYEIVLVFEDDINQQVALYHLWIPIEELHFDMNMVFEFHLNQYSTYDHSDIMTMNINDSSNPNWHMIIDRKKFDAMLIKNSVIFVTLYSKDKSHQSIIGMYLKGQPFFDERLVGLEYKRMNQVIELIPCLYRTPFIVAGQWQVGCDVQQKIRYYFPE